MTATATSVLQAGFAASARPIWRLGIACGRWCGTPIRIPARASALPRTCRQGSCWRIFARRSTKWPWSMSCPRPSSMSTFIAAIKAGKDGSSRSAHLPGRGGAVARRRRGAQRSHPPARPLIRGIPRPCSTAHRARGRCAALRRRHRAAAARDRRIRLHKPPVGVSKHGMYVVPRSRHCISPRQA